MTPQGAKKCAISLTQHTKIFATIALVLFTHRLGSAATIIVTDASSQEHLGGVQVVSKRGSESVTNVTDAEGKCTLTSELSSITRIDVQKEGWCPMRWDSTPIQAQDTVTFKMKPARNVGGIVQDGDGKGIPGAKIFLNFPQRLFGPHIPVEDFSVMTDAKGRWSANFVPADAEYVHLDVLHPDYSWEEGQPSREMLLKGQAVLRMEPILSLQGVVLDPQRNPVAGATVCRGQQWGIMGFNQGNEVTTDQNGHFRFPSDRTGRMQVAALAPNFGPVIQEVEMTKESAPLELVLTAPHVRRIRVTDLEGNGLSNVTVRVSQWKSFHYPPWRLKPDVLGRITISNAPADELQIDFRAPHRMGLTFHHLPPSEEEQVIQLGPALRLHGKVIDAETGKLIPSFKVTPGWPRQVFRNGQLTNDGGQWAFPQQAKKFRAGTYDWTFEEHVIAGTEKVYDFLLRVEADGYAPAVSRAFKPTEKDAKFDFKLSKASYATGDVRFADGSPARGAQIYLVHETWELNAMNGRIRNLRGAPTLTADDAGQFKILTGQDAETLVVWHENGFASIRYADFLKTNLITLTKWGEIKGTLMRGDHPASHEKVALCFEQQRRRVGQADELAPQIFFNYQGTTTDDGHFVFDKVPPGVTAISRVEDVPRPQAYGLPLGDVWAACRLAVVNVHEGETVSLKAGGTGRTVTGQFVFTNDFSLCVATLTRKLPPVPFPESVDQTQKGDWASQWFWSEAVEPYRIWLGGPLQDGKPTRFRGDTGHSWAVRVEKNGQFEIPDVPAGAYVLRVSFLSHDQTAGMPMRRISEAIGLTREFEVPAGTNLPQMPQLDLGAIGNSPKENEFAVAEPSAHQPVTAAMKADHADIEPGNNFEMIVRVRIAEGHHIFAASPKSKVFTGTSISLDLPAGVESVSDWSEPAPVVARDGENVFTNSVVYRRTLKLTDASHSGPISFKGELHYQACNDQLCWPPNSIPITATVAVQQPLKGKP